MRTTYLIASIFLATALLAAGCKTGTCADAVEHAEACGVDGLELDDDFAGCSDHEACRASCVLDAPCDEIKASFAGGTDRSTEAWRCYEQCPISD
ncbi:hypothetical protein [Sorangium sp. So ce117]|uniref:hypothetical protein n=1 Tax=Sorangium sp. So ce117 TaxID=3133277 RepID=UPI003F6177E9